MRKRLTLFVSLLVLLAMGIAPAILEDDYAYAQDLRCLPLSLLCPVDMFVITPMPGATTSDLQPDIIIEVVSNTQELLTNELRMLISGCDAPNSSGFRISDSGVGYVTNSNEYLDHMIARLDEMGCTLPSNSEIEVTVMAKARDFTGSIAERGRTWTFNTPNVPSGPPPQQPPSSTSPTPLPQISSINAPSGISTGARVQVNGTGFVSTGSYQSYVLFDSSMTDYTGNLGASTLEFYIPNDAECGDHTVQVANPRSGGQIPRYSNVHVVEVECDDASPPSNDTVRLEIDSFSPGAAGEVGDRITIRGSGFSRNTIVYFGRIELDPQFVDREALQFVVPRDAECEIYEVYVEEGRESSNTLEFKVTDPCGPNNAQPPADDPPPGEDPPPNDDPPPSPPPFTGGDELEDYDTDGNCTLSDIEFFALLDAWLAASIGDATFFAGVDAWIGGFDVCAASTNSSIAVELAFNTRGLMIASSSGEALGQINIYDSNGRGIFSQAAQTSRLFWTLRDRYNQPVANGVYWLSVPQNTNDVGATNRLIPIIIMR